MRLSCAKLISSLSNLSFACLPNFQNFIIVLPRNVEKQVLPISSCFTSSSGCCSGLYGRCSADLCALEAYLGAGLAYLGATMKRKLRLSLVISYICCTASKTKMLICINKT